jgi:hypothetical protein
MKRRELSLGGLQMRVRLDEDKAIYLHAVIEGQMDIKGLGCSSAWR